ncbi:hypothetical protein [Mycobacterium dioxanotrophicus]|uniref:hypothetical protein n=1 Tax=Mycobacterium dioxanotrophicus TaxID=482462 RepID=UPI0012F8305D|nr:hypothetical protein [Mycobacterium dioxanotrophicus]
MSSPGVRQCGGFQCLELGIESPWLVNEIGVATGTIDDELARFGRIEEVAICRGFAVMSHESSTATAR